MGKFYGYGLTAAVSAFFLIAVPLQSASAHPPEKAIKVRQAMMKELNGHSKAFKKFFKGGKTKKQIARAGTAADVGFRAHAISHIITKYTRMFPKGSSTNEFGSKTRAKPAIWEKKDEFRAKGRNLRTLALQVEKAAATGDMGKIKAAYAKMGKQGCGGCHKLFRGKKMKK